MADFASCDDDDEGDDASLSLFSSRCLLYVCVKVTSVCCTTTLELSTRCLCGANIGSNQTGCTCCVWRLRVREGPRQAGL